MADNANRIADILEALSKGRNPEADEALKKFRESADKLISTIQSVSKEADSAKRISELEAELAELKESASYKTVVKQRDEISELHKQLQGANDGRDQLVQQIKNQAETIRTAREVLNGHD